MAFNIVGTAALIGLHASGSLEWPLAMTLATSLLTPSETKWRVTALTTALFYATVVTKTVTYSSTYPFIAAGLVLVS